MRSGVSGRRRGNDRRFEPIDHTRHPIVETEPVEIGLTGGRGEAAAEGRIGEDRVQMTRQLPVVVDVEEDRAPDVREQVGHPADPRYDQWQPQPESLGHDAGAGIGRELFAGMRRNVRSAEEGAVSWL